MNPITLIKGKLQAFLCIVLATLLMLSYLTGRADRLELKQVSEKLTEHVQLNLRLSEQNLALAKEVKDKPVQYITITKEVEKQVCNGIVKQNMINAIPSKNEAVDEKNTADIDDRLPADLIKLLN